MPIHYMKLSQQPFEKIVNGKKIIESRLFDEKRQSINIGDCIEFSQDNDPSKTISTQVIALYRYPTFKELFSDFPAEYFGGISKDFLVNEIIQFYSEEDQSKYGVLGIKIKLS